MLDKQTIFHIQGDIATISGIDAKAAVQDHGDEWSFEPWSATQRAEARQAEMAAAKAAAAPSLTIDAKIAPLTGVVRSVRAN